MKNTQLVTEAPQLVATGLARGWLSVRKMSPQEVAFVRNKLIRQTRAEQQGEQIKRDPELWARKLAANRRYRKERGL